MYIRRVFLFKETPFFYATKGLLFFTYLYAMNFQEFNLNKPLLNALEDMQITEATTIQQKTFSPIMSGKDVVGIAQTGTGKTLAYLLPILRLWKFSKSPFPSILIIVPTRELVMQVVGEIEKLSTYMNLEVVGVYGGTNMRTQKYNVHAGIDAIVGTPGRLLDLMLDGILKPTKIKKLVIDEVDEMLDLGFRTQLKNIIDFLPEKRQNLMFSATMTEEVEAIITEYTSYYDKIEAAPSGAPLKNIVQYIYKVPNFNSKANLLELLLKEQEEIRKALVFVSTKRMADALFERMHAVFEDQVGVIHSSKSQNYRFNTVEAFEDGTFRLIIATDVVARGLDVSSVTHVFNFDLPETAERYIHRIGRTGRAAQKGVAVSFIAEGDEAPLAEVEELMSTRLPVHELPANLELSEELIPLEEVVEEAPLNLHKFLTHEKTAEDGDAFHEKLDKNKKVNKKIRRAEAMKMKYKMPLTRGDKRKKKKKKR